ncbi:aldo/keto reductase [Synechocystis sp. LEGE 06083]|uniref:aldo/keto reductase n=1 Tax=Synechocystis sp. LEGE 06083 TaxID=915336 RepID=UPI00187F9054|nr:aldo/keto reductase [Synechocystis sp. LEGE 06083]MBE9195037.1 aldo/keto reductase [Synechocystis sp. LEGE 06083]
MTVSTTEPSPIIWPTMGCGTWAWGNKLLWGYQPAMDGELQRVFEQCVAAGITFFDTGDSYGTGRLQGQSEKLLGQFSQAYGGANQDKICLATKLAPYPWRLTPQAMVKAGIASRERLQRPIDLVQLHWSTANYAPWQEQALLKGLAQLCQRGDAKALGLSNFGPKRLQKAYNFCRNEGIRITSLQVQYSLLSTDPVSKLGLKDLCDQLDIKLIAYSPLTLGLLTGKYSPQGPFPPGIRGLLFRRLLPKIKPLLDTLQAIATEREKTMAQVALNWCICQGTMPIPGAKNCQQVQDNLGALGWKLDSGEMDELNGQAASLPQTMVQNIFQSR